MNAAVDTPFQVVLASFEVSALLAGAFFLVRLLASPTRRADLLHPNRLVRWPIAGVEVALLLMVILLLAITGQSAAAYLLGPVIKASTDRRALEVAVYGFGFHGAALFGWPLFGILRRHIYADNGAVPPAPVAAPGPRARWPRVFLFGALTFAMALPVLTVSVMGWNAVLRAAGLPEEPQDLIGIFGSARSPGVIAAMLLVAVVVAPINEELVFRKGVFRFLRQRYGRPTGLAVSALCFGALHMNWFSFLPLAVFGAVLAVAYEATGDIRVPMVAHALFNLNTVLYILSGLPQ